jgi:hypothetical protein
MPRGLQANDDFSTPNIDRGFQGLVLSERIGWNLSSILAGETKIFQMVFWGADQALGSVKPLHLRVEQAGNSQVNQQTSITFDGKDSQPIQVLLTSSHIPASAGETLQFVVTYGNYGEQGFVDG